MLLFGLFRSGLLCFARRGRSLLLVLLSLTVFLVASLPVQSLALGRAIEDQSTKRTSLGTHFIADVASFSDIGGRGRRFAKTVRVGGSLASDLGGDRLCLGKISHLVGVAVVISFG